MSNFAAKAKQVLRIARLEEPGLMVVVGHRISQVMFGAAHTDRLEPPHADRAWCEDRSSSRLRRKRAYHRPRATELHPNHGHSLRRPLLTL